MDHTKKHLTRLVGSMIIGVEVDDPELPTHRRMYGLHVKTPEGEHLIAWSWRDPEGNGPGFIDIEDVATARVHPAEIELTRSSLADDQPIDARLTEKGRQALETAAKPLWRCAECGSLDVQGQLWVRLRDKAVVDAGGVTDDDDYWCPKCGDHVALERVDE